MRSSVRSGKKIHQEGCKPWARFTLLERKGFLLSNVSGAYEQYGMKIEDGAIMVVEGVASNRDGEVRVNANAILPINQALAKWVKSDLVD